MGARLSANHRRSLEASGRLKIKGDLGADQDFTFQITASLPPSVNGYLKRSQAGGVFKSQRAKAYQEQVGKLAKVAGAKMAEGDVSVIVTYYAKPDELDLDNGNKVLLDSMNGVAWIDDRQVRRILIERQPREEKQKPYAVILIQRYKP